MSHIILEIIGDLFLLLKFGVFYFHTVLTLWFKNIFIPSKYLYKKVDDEIVLVTGAASGIGKLMAKKFLAHNAIVICADVNEVNLNETVNEFKAEFPQKRLFSYKIDVSSYDQIKALVQRIRKDVGNITILVNNAGIVNAKSILELTEAQVRRIFDINILAHFWLCKEVLPAMIDKNKGHIINISSVCGIQGSDKLTDYCATKFAVYGFSESLRIELKVANPASKIVISTVCPFYIRTPLFSGVEFDHLNWLDVAMEPEYAVKQIFHGILLEKKLIYVPRFLTTLVGFLKAIPFTDFTDFSSSTLVKNAIERKKVK